VLPICHWFSHVFASVNNLFIRQPGQKLFFFGMFYFSFNFIITHKIFLLFYNIKNSHRPDIPFDHCTLGKRPLKSEQNLRQATFPNEGFLCDFELDKPICFHQMNGRGLDTWIFLEERKSPVVL